MLFDSCPRISRTDTCPLGRSVTGLGIPAICLGSGIWSWAEAGETKVKSKKWKVERQAISSARSLEPQDLQNLASSSFTVLQDAQTAAARLKSSPTPSPTPTCCPDVVEGADASSGSTLS